MCYKFCISEIKLLDLIVTIQLHANCLVGVEQPYFFCSTNRIQLKKDVYKFTNLNL